MATFKHLVLRGVGKAPEQFRAPGRGRSKPIRPVPDRRGHADKLMSELDTAIEELSDIKQEQRTVGIPNKDRGLIVAIEGVEGQELRTGATRSTSRGLKLLGIKRRAFPQQGENQGDIATYFVTTSMAKSLSKAIDKYGDFALAAGADGTFQDIDDDDEDDGESVRNEVLAGFEAPARKPGNFKLFETATAIRAATIHDLWTDPDDDFPRRNDTFRWEVWVRKAFQPYFVRAARDIGLEVLGETAEFIEVTVTDVLGTPEQIQRLIRASAAVVELKSASQLAADYMKLEPEARTRATANLNGRAAPTNSADAPRVAILDTGINRTHPLLSGSLSALHCYAASQQWPVTDHSGHGTKMAGVALYGDLTDKVSAAGSLPLSFKLESVVVTQPSASTTILAGRDAITRAVELVEHEEAKRVFCLAQTAPGERTAGKSTSTSAVLDQLAYGGGTKPRLFCVAAGNVPTSANEPYQVFDYESRNRRFALQAPGQALNVLTIGAATQKTAGRTPLVSPSGDLAPTSRSAEDWIPPHANKPDVVMEGGNFAVDPDEIYSRPSAQNLVLTTSRDHVVNPFGLTGETSAATARAAGVLGRVLAAYPQLHPESLRGLMTHVASWTPAMTSQVTGLVAQGTARIEAMRIVMARYGYGIPDEQRIMFSAEHDFTMIVEDTLQPYELGDNGIRLKEMKYFKLPWPTDLLTELDNERVEMRCTLSYFIEPDPHADTRARFERYPSHRLRFDVKRFDEDDETAQSRLNDLAEGSTRTDNEGWHFGPSLYRGSLQQDVWSGPAYQLAEKDGISVGPMRGWWGDMKDVENYRRTVNFSLIVSLRVPAGNDLLSEIRTKIPVSLQVVAPVPAS